LALRAPDIHLAPHATAAAPSILTRIVLYWRWLCLSLLLGLAAALESIGLSQEGYGNTYYAAGVKSMLTSWHNFFFISFDAGGFVSLDKPPLGFWIQTASAKLFGFSGVSLLAPEVVAGVLSVALLYHLVARAHGAVAGLLAALLLAVTPISAIIDRNNTIDSLLIFTLLLGVWAISLATERGQLRWLLLAALLVGLGFNIKMLQAYLVVPGFVLVYLLVARLPLRTRLVHLLLAGVVLLVVSFCWVAAVDLTPASLRPFVSDSGTNSELSLDFGYNGLGRLTQALFPGLTRISIFGDPIDLTIEPGFSAGIGNPGLLRLVSSAIGGQASWFLLPALVGLLARVRLVRPRLAQDRQGQSVLLWTMWLLLAGVFFSTARFFHFYYLVMIAPPIAALGGIGLITLWREYRQSLDQGPRAGLRGWLLPATLAGTAVLQTQFLNGYPDWSFWLEALMIGGSLIAAIVLVLGKLGLLLQFAPDLSFRVTAPVAAGSLALGLLALLAAPTTWAIAGVASGEGGAWLPQAGSIGFSGGPGGQRGFAGNGAPGGFRFSPGSGGAAANSGGSGSQTGTARGGPPGGSFRAGPGGQPGAPPGGGFGGGGFGGGFGGGNTAMTFAGSQTPALDAKLLAYLEQHQGTARYLVATATSSYASLFILQTNQPAMALGGYQGWDRILTLAQLKALIATGTIRFFYLSPSSQSGSSGRLSTGTSQGSTSRHAGQGAGPSGVAQSAASQQLAGTNDDLTRWVTRACTAVPAKLWQTASSTTSATAHGGGLQLYDCAGRANVP
jgi:4-amino-4-deoxy-L-arabinose transferase-like glycosyltransferase